MSPEIEQTQLEQWQITIAQFFKEEEVAQPPKETWRDYCSYTYTTAEMDAMESQEAAEQAGQIQDKPIPRSLLKDLQQVYDQARQGYFGNAPYDHDEALGQIRGWLKNNNYKITWEDWDWIEACIAQV